MVPPRLIKRSAMRARRQTGDGIKREALRAHDPSWSIGGGNGGEGGMQREKIQTTRGRGGGGREIA